MAAIWHELRDVRSWALLIEAAGGLIIAGYALAAFGVLLLRRDRARARRVVASGALTALSLMVCATLLKTLLLTSWRQIGLFAAVLALRAALKQIFIAEAQVARDTEGETSILRIYTDKEF